MFNSRLAVCRLLWFVVVLTLSAATLSRAATAQPMGEQRSRFELSAFTGWAVNSDPDTNYGRLSLGDAQSFGASLGISGYGGTLELKWIYFQPTVQLIDYSASIANRMCPHLIMGKK